jgi:multicomponent Na+:H+ antiporter subunit G
MFELVGSVFILAGAVFLFSAGLGLLRMPDAYTRIQAGTKASTLGNMLVLVGLAFYHPGWSFRLILLIYFVLVTNPVSSHALSRAAWLMRTPMSASTVSDALADDGELAREEAQS